MRIARLALGAAIVLLAIWVLIGEQMARASANAVVNAPVVTLRTPIAGTVALPDRRLGTSVAENEVVASISDPLPDAVRRNDLEMERAFGEAEVARLEAVLASTREVAETLAARSARFTERQIADLELRLGHARERLALLGEGGPDGSPSPRAAAPASIEESRLREEVDVLENALAAARDGVFVGDGYNDAPNAEQRRIELVTAIAGIEADLETAKSRLAALSARVDQERLSVNRRLESEIVATANGRIWDMLASDGERVQRGDPVLRLLDCDALVVTLSVTQNIYNGLRVGDTGHLRLSGSGEVLEGTVIRLAGSGASAIYRNLAVAPSAQQLERFDVALAVQGLQTNPQLSCPVGRTGRVFFEERPLDWLRGLF